MSPILVRPVREQLEHDRIIRLLQSRYKRRFMTAINPGAEQNHGLGEGSDALFPDLVLMPTGKGRKLAGVVEVETQESVNTLEAIAQWALYGRLPVEFALYVPAGSMEVAKRLCADNRIGVTEIWTYHTIGDQMRFTQVLKAPVEAKVAAARAAVHAAAAQQKEAERLEKAAKRAAARRTAAKRPARAKAPAVRGVKVSAHPKPRSAAPRKTASKPAPKVRKR